MKKTPTQNPLIKTLTRALLFGALLAAAAPHPA